MKIRKTSPAATFALSLAAAGLALTLPAMLGASSAAAQDQLSNQVSVQRFDPAPGPRNFLTTRGNRSDGNMTWSAGLFANYAYESFVANTQEPSGNVQRVPVVENMVTGDFMGSFTIIPQLQLGLKVPVTWVDGQGITSDGAPLQDGLSAVGMGDIQLEVKGRFYGDVDDLFTAGAYLYGTAPTSLLHSGDDDTFTGSDLPTVGGAFIADILMGPLSASANLGGVYRQAATLGNSTTLGAELRWGVGGGYEIGPLIKVLLDVYGSTNFTGDLGTNNVEVDAAVAITPGLPLTITVGGGAGVWKGVGTPAARGILGVMWVSESKDRDRDGLPDDQDTCPSDAEDMDGYEDSDGCPDFDNDSDGLPDEADKCPDEPEDVDNFEDKDGCPEPDNDGDGIADKDDFCPNEAETKNGIDDIDGCPEKEDEDNDGIEDKDDKCKSEPEDMDGFQDEDGCPDPDNDQDGVLDNEDECFDLKEDGKGKGHQKKDGCPIDA